MVEIFRKIEIIEIEVVRKAQSFKILVRKVEKKQKQKNKEKEKTVGILLSS